jgi:hypothetical protein
MMGRMGWMGRMSVLLAEEAIDTFMEAPFSANCVRSSAIAGFDGSEC